MPKSCFCPSPIPRTSSSGISESCSSPARGKPAPTNLVHPSATAEPPTSVGADLTPKAQLRRLSRRRPEHLHRAATNTDTYRGNPWAPYHEAPGWKARSYPDCEIRHPMREHRRKEVLCAYEFK